jgi:aminoglycoside 6'-N-acetyltransferase I
MVVGAPALEAGRCGQTSMIRIRRLRLEDAEEWTALRTALWPHCSPADHESDIRDTLARPDRLAAYGAEHPAVGIVGFAEFSVRDVVDGATSSPCGFLEGWYVDPARRRQGIGGALVASGEAWLASLGIREIGSDTGLHNSASIATHAALGFVETDRVVQFVKTVSRDG